MSYNIITVCVLYRYRYMYIYIYIYIMYTISCHDLACGLRPGWRGGPRPVAASPPPAAQIRRDF